MPTIRFHYELKLALDVAYETWRRQLAPQPDEPGETRTATEAQLGPVIWEGGGDPHVTQSIPAEFLTFLTACCPHTLFEVLD